MALVIKAVFCFRHKIPIYHEDDLGEAGKELCAFTNTLHLFLLIQDNIWLGSVLQGRLEDKQTKTLKSKPKYPSK